MISEKRNILEKYGLSAEERLFAAAFLDKAEKSLRGYLTHTSFMDSRQRALGNRLIKDMGFKGVMHGGYEEAERALCLFLPDYMEEVSQEELPLIVLSAKPISAKFSKSLSHRDCLGALMGLGIKREMVGDLLIHEEECQIIVLEEMASYINDNLTQISSVQVSTAFIGLTELRRPETRCQNISATVASLRLDAVMAEGFRLSRGEAQRFIEAGRVSLCHMECTKPDKSVDEGDLITVRGLGRVRLKEVGGNSRKNRIFISLERFV